MSFNKAKALKTAAKYVQQGKYQAAIEEYRHIAVADQTDVTTLNTLGDLYVKVGQTGEAIHSFLHIAEHYRLTGFYLKAIAMLKKISKLDPNNVDVSLKLASLYAQQKLIVDARHQYLNVAERYIREGQTRDALQIYQKIADLDPENTAIHIKLAEALLRESEPEAAHESFLLAAGELRRQGKENEAIQVYLRAIRANPKGQAALAALVNLYLQRNEHDEAIRMLEGLLAEQVNEAETLTLLARVYQSVDRLDAAEEAIDKMLFAAPTRYQYAVDLALLHVRRSDIVSALRVYDRVWSILVEHHEGEKAAYVLREVIAAEPDNLGALNRLVTVYERTNEDHLLIETLNTLVNSALRVDDHAAAIGSLKKLVQLEPDEIQHRRRLRDLEGEDQAEATDYAFESEYQEAPAGDNAWGGTEEAPASVQAEAESGSSWGSWEPAGAGSWASGQSKENSFEIETAGQGSSLQDELESVDFYLEQGMLDVARYTLEAAEKNYPNEPAIEQKFAQLSAAEAASVQTFLAQEGAESAWEVTPEPQAATPIFAGHDMAMGEIVNEPETFFEAEPVMEAPPVLTAPLPAAAPVNGFSLSAPTASGGFDLFDGEEMSDLMDFLDEFKSETTVQETSEDFDTHYNLGLAYKEMDMFDEAIEEFQQAFKSIMNDTRHPSYVPCCSMLGYCFTQKGLPRLAIMWLKKGLDTPNLSEDICQSLRYDLADAYAATGDYDNAFETFSEVYAIDVQYRNVKTRLQEVTAQMGK